MSEKLDSAMVGVALGVSKNSQQAVGEKPDAEELAAFFDGGLDVVRRAQVLSHIVNDTEIYGQWLDFVDYAEAVGLESSVTESIQAPVQAEQKENLFERIRNLFSLKTAVPAMTFAAVAAFMFTLNLQPKNVGDLYGEFGAAPNVAIELPTRSLGNFWQKPDDESVLMSHGYLDGLKKLDRLGNIEHLLAQKHSAGEARKNLANSAQLYEALGQWAAISELYCKAGKTEFESAAEEVWLELRGQLSDLNTPYSKALLEEPALKQGQACQVAAVLSKRVI